MVRMMHARETFTPTIVCARQRSSVRLFTRPQSCAPDSAVRWRETDTAVSAPRVERGEETQARRDWRYAGVKRARHANDSVLSALTRSPYSYNYATQVGSNGFGGCQVTHWGATVGVGTVVVDRSCRRVFAVMATSVNAAGAVGRGRRARHRGHGI